MAELDDEDLTRFDLDALIAAANEIAEGMKKNGARKEDAEKLRKVALEIHKKSEPRAAPTPAVAPPAQVGFAKRSLERGIPSRTKNLKPPGRRG